MAKPAKASKTKEPKKRPVSPNGKQKVSSVRMTTPLKMSSATPKKKRSAQSKREPVRDFTKTPRRFKCRMCGYIYSPLRGEPQNGIPAGTEFEDLPDDYVCPVCGFEGRGKIGTWGFEEWRPTKYICALCGYVYDEARGEPHRGIKAGTKFEDLPDTYVCPVCAMDPKIDIGFGKVFKQGFGPLYIP